jgi:hypothetical protein
MCQMIDDGIQILTERLRLRKFAREDIPFDFSASRFPGFCDGMKWELPDLPGSTMEALLKAGFPISITRTEAKFKLGQNRSPEDKERMLLSLAAALQAKREAAWRRRAFRGLGCKRVWNPLSL